MSRKHKSAKLLDELLDLLVEFNRPVVEELCVEVDG